MLSILEHGTNGGARRLRLKQACWGTEAAAAGLFSESEDAKCTLGFNASTGIQNPDLGIDIVELTLPNP